MKLFSPNSTATWANTSLFTKVVRTNCKPKISPLAIFFLFSTELFFVRLIGLPKIRENDCKYNDWPKIEELNRPETQDVDYCLFEGDQWQRLTRTDCQLRDEWMPLQVGEYVGSKFLLVEKKLNDRLPYQWHK